MRISVFGLGYVGAVSAACLANARHEVIGVDPDASKVDLINRGLPPVIEADLAELTKAGVETGRLKATTNPHAALSDADLAVVAVGTRSHRNGSIDLSFVRRVAEQIGELIRDRDEDSVTGVPLLSSIPVLGNLFKTTQTLVRRTELLVLITPRVVRGAPQARAVTEELRKRLTILQDVIASAE